MKTIFTVIISIAIIMAIASLSHAVRSRKHISKRTYKSRKSVKRYRRKSYTAKSNYYGRVSMGSFISKESYSTSITGSSSNDVAVFSSRFYLRYSDQYRKRYNLIADIRDKHDLFDKVDKSRIQLTGANTLQVRQLSLQYGFNTLNLNSKIGRMPIVEAGSVHTDGFELSRKLGSFSKFAIFGGLNPHSNEKSYLEYNTDAKVYGGYFLYQTSPKRGSNYAYVSNGYTIQRVNGETDRSFLFQNLTYQWNRNSRWISIMYLDFVPRVYFQNLYASYYRRWSQRFNSRVNVNAYDVITYSRNSGVREQLDPSPYRAASIDLRYNTSKKNTLKSKLTYGKRLSDGLYRIKLDVGVANSRFFGKHTYATYLVGLTDNFVAKDVHARMEIGYNSLKWNSFLNAEVLYEKEDSGNNHTPFQTEIGSSYIFGKSLFGSLSFTYTTDSHVNIVSSFAKLNYRFGKLGDVPTRDSAPLSNRL